MLPETGERCLSPALFNGIEVDMNEGELALSRSTPGCRFDAAPAEPRAAAAPAPQPVWVLDPQAAAFVSQAIHEHLVLMFAREWCEFCWAVRKLLARPGVPFESVDVDAATFQADDMGTRVRAVLKARSGQPTIPQIWIGGTHVGGAMDLFAAVRSGRLQPLLAAAGVANQGAADIDPDPFLPKWLHPRKAA